jgi:hypothetical protein
MEGWAESRAEAGSWPCVPCDDIPDGSVSPYLVGIGLGEGHDSLSAGSGAGPPTPSSTSAGWGSPWTTSSTQGLHVLQADSAFLRVPGVTVGFYVPKQSAAMTWVMIEIKYLEFKGFYMEDRCMMNSPRVVSVPTEGAGNADGSWAGFCIRMLSDLQFTTIFPFMGKEWGLGGFSMLAGRIRRRLGTGGGHSRGRLPSLRPPG